MMTMCILMYFFIITIENYFARKKHIRLSREKKSRVNFLFCIRTTPDQFYSVERT